MKDWGISRQRYWGCPIPMIHLEDGSIVPVEKNELPIKLPEDIDLNKVETRLKTQRSWKNTIHKKTGKTAIRETDTLRYIRGLILVFLRFCSPEINFRTF